MSCSFQNISAPAEHWTCPRHMGITVLSHVVSPPHCLCNTDHNSVPISSLFCTEDMLSMGLLNKSGADRFLALCFVSPRWEQQQDPVQVINNQVAQSRCWLVTHRLLLESFILTEKWVLIYIHSLSLKGATSSRVSKEGGEVAPSPWRLQPLAGLHAQSGCWAGLGQHREGWTLWHAGPQMCSQLKPQSLLGNVCGVCKVSQRHNQSFCLWSLTNLRLPLASPPGSLVPWALVSEHQTSTSEACSNPTWTPLPGKGPQRGCALSLF